IEILPESTMNTDETSKSSVSPKSPRSPLDLTEKIHSPVTSSLSEFEEVMNVEQQALPTSVESMPAIEENYEDSLQKKKKAQEEKLSTNEDLAPAVSNIYSHSISTLEERLEQQATFVSSTPIIKDQEKMPEIIHKEKYKNNKYNP